ncbi:MAG: alginate lyase family protein [Bacteroidota bacterium]
MGWRYVRFRGLFELKRKTGILKNKFPTNPRVQQFISLEEWKKLPVQYFFQDKNDLKILKNPNTQLKRAYQQIQSGKLSYFNSTLLEIGQDYDWLTNPSNDYQYDQNKHWLDIPDLSQEAGDIKYVWEKSRFSYLYEVIRYDYHFEEDCAAFVLEEIESWIAQNPINQGPNWRCSQEISLRTMNWLFALYYYKRSPELTEARFQKIMQVIYWQLKHDYDNINFSRIAVRNNHAITETLMLYLAGIFFPFFPEAAKWKHKGKQWFEEEIAYQVYEDGTFLQFSHNYHRVLIQLMTQAFYLAELNNESFSDLTYERAKKSLNYLYQCTNLENGQLPNYGANDGALFFKLNDQPYRDYRSQLNALAYFFNKEVLFEDKELEEDIAWFANSEKLTAKDLNFKLQKEKISRFSQGGYYLMQNPDSFTFIKCGSYKDRPSHADNLHIDIWYKGENVLRDAGTYRYNTEPELVRYFNGTSAHNTVTLGDEDQMEKGPRFIWFNWSSAESAKVREAESEFIFEGKIKIFQHLGQEIYHNRKVIQPKEEASWEIEDTVEHQTDLPIRQYWNTSDGFHNYFKISAKDEEGNELKVGKQKGYYSGLYGQKEETEVIVFSSKGKKISTKIQLK